MTQKGLIKFPLLYDAKQLLNDGSFLYNVKITIISEKGILWKTLHYEVTGEPEQVKKFMHYTITRTKRYPHGL